MYCYVSIQDSLQELLLRPAFVVECEQWRSRQVKPGVMEDIFDGDLWKDFQAYEDKFSKQEVRKSSPCIDRHQAVY